MSTTLKWVFFKCLLNWEPSSHKMKSAFLMKMKLNFQNALPAGARWRTIWGFLANISSLIMNPPEMCLSVKILQVTTLASESKAAALAGHQKSRSELLLVDQRCMPLFLSPWFSAEWADSHMLINLWKVNSTFSCTAVHGSNPCFMVPLLENLVNTPHCITNMTLSIYKIPNYADRYCLILLLLTVVKLNTILCWLVSK